jgi:hypothetical protein
MEVVFIQKGKNGVRWGMYSVMPLSAAKDKIVGPGTTWEVAAVGDEDNPITSIIVSGTPSSIVFDGDKLTAF